jgi:glycosyltransferase involved in cell wall biosynthesis
MNLLVFCHEYPPIGGGASNGLYNLARSWAQQGHQVTVVTSAFKNIPCNSVEEGIRVVRLNVGRRFADHGRVREMLRYILAATLRIARWRREFRPDLTVAFMTIPAGPPAWAMKLLFGIPYAVELRGGDVPGFDPIRLKRFHLLTRPAIKALWKNAAVVISNSKGLQDLARQSAPVLCSQVIPNGVDHQFFTPVAGEAKTKSGQKVRLIYVGRLADSQKKVSELIEVLGDISGAELVLAGDGIDHPTLVALAGRLGLSDRVIFKGWLSKQELTVALGQADVFVSASRWEGMPNAVLEAMASGLPLVLTRGSGHDDLITDGVNGFLFEPGSKESLAATLQKLTENPGLRTDMGTASRRMAVERFGWEQLSKLHLELYLKAVNDKRSQNLCAA